MRSKRETRIVKDKKDKREAMKLSELSSHQEAELLTTSLEEWQDGPQVLTYGAILICRKGRAVVNVNYKDWELYEGAVITVFPNDVVELRKAMEVENEERRAMEVKKEERRVKNPSALLPESSYEKQRGEQADSSLFVLSSSLKSSSLFQVEMLKYNPSLLREASLQLEQTVYSSLREDRCRQDSPVVTNIINNMFALLKVYFDQSECTCISQLVLCQLKAFFIGFHEYLQRNPQSRPDDVKSYRVRKLFNHFMMLVERDYRLSRDVNYYARLMNITPKYLTLIVRQVTDHTPKAIIDQYVVLQIKMQLQHTTQSIKEIAWEYHFSDTSFFCRYYKKHTGMTPRQVRE